MKFDRYDLAFLGGVIAIAAGLFLALGWPGIVLFVGLCSVVISFALSQTAKRGGG